MSTYDVMGKSYHYAVFAQGMSVTPVDMTKMVIQKLTTDFIAFDSVIGDM